VTRRWEGQFLEGLGRLGYPFHVGLALVWCVACFGPTAAVELAGLPLAGCMVLRLPFVWRSLRDALLQPTLIVGMLWALWLCASVLWTSDRGNAGHELSFLRWMWTPVALWVVIDQRRWMIVAMKGGALAALLAQAGEWIGHRYDIAALVWSHPPSPEPASRISGWWQQPAVGGAMLVLALGLHLGPALLATGWRRWVGLLASLATLAGLVLTGARGGVLAGLALTAIMVLAALWIQRRRRGGGVLLVVVLLAGVVGAAALASPAGSKIRKRVQQGLHDVRLVVVPDVISSEGERDAPNFNSDTGARLYAALSAVRITSAHPLLGAGAGSFQGELRDLTFERAVGGKPELEPRRQEALKTAHNTLLQALATTGVIGAGLLLLTLLSVLSAGAARARAERPAHAVHWLGTSAAAPAIALLGLLLAGCFETTYLNMSTAAVSCVLIGLCPRVVPTRR
jgi:hypothetical protein